MRRKLVIGNWKMFGRLARNQALLEGLLTGVRDLHNTDCAVCVPYPYLAQVQSVLQGNNVTWGAQNLSHHDEGAEIDGRLSTVFFFRAVSLQRQRGAAGKEKIPAHAQHEHGYQELHDVDAGERDAYA